jgi:hypothetical protein
LDLKYSEYYYNLTFDFEIIIVIYKIYYPLWNWTTKLGYNKLPRSFSLMELAKTLVLEISLEAVRIIMLKSLFQKD